MKTRRNVLVDAAQGFGALALQHLLVKDASAAAPRVNPLAPKQPHFEPKAKSVIFLFMVGAPSQIDTFNRIFSPTAAELADADALIAEAGGGAARHAGRMIEGMHVVQARRSIARARR